MYAYQTPALLFQAADTYINFIKGGIFFMDTYVILKDLAIIIVFAKLFGILARKCKAPQVVDPVCWDSFSNLTFSHKWRRSVSFC